VPDELSGAVGSLFRNVFLNVANEHTSYGWDDTADVFDFRDPGRIVELCEVVHDVDGNRLVGGSGNDVSTGFYRWAEILYTVNSIRPVLIWLVTGTQIRETNRREAAVHTGQRAESSRAWTGARS
jgi:hypothetical protein